MSLPEHKVIYNLVCRIAANDKVNAIIANSTPTMEDTGDAYVITGKSPTNVKATRYAKLEKMKQQLELCKQQIESVVIMPDSNTPISPKYLGSIRLSSSGYLKITGKKNKQKIYYFMLGVPGQESLHLTPQDLSLTDKDYTNIATYETKLVNGLTQLANSKPELSTFLTSVMEKVKANKNTINGTTMISIMQNVVGFHGMKKSTNKAINKEFGECLAPLIMMNSGIFGSEQITKIIFPPNKTASLYDSIIVTDNKNVYYCSSKVSHGGSVNTVKPKSIMEMFAPSNRNVSDALKKELNDLKQTDEYKIIEILHTNDAKNGPLKVLETYGKSYFNITKPVSDFVEAAKIIQEYTKKEKGEEFGRLLSVAATNYNLYFVKFGLKKIGNGVNCTVGVAAPSLFKNSERRSYLRDKGVKDGERMGLVPY